jgi:transposase
LQSIIIKNTKKFNNQTLIVSVDVGMMDNYGYCRCPDGQELNSFKFGNNGMGLIDFWTRIDTYREKHGLSEMVVGFESTGIYNEPLIHFLRNKPVRMVQVNPMHTKRVKELQGNSPNKTDKKDPKVIADIMELGRYLTVVVPEGVSAELRYLVHARERTIQSCNRYYNQLHALIFTLFPEFFSVIKDITSKTSLYLLEHLPLPSDVLRCGIEPLAQKIRKISRGKLGMLAAQELYSGAVHSAGVQIGQESIIFEMKQLIVFIKASEALIHDIENKITAYLRQIPYSRFLLSMKGIGPMTVAGLIGEYGDMLQFRTLKEILKFGGLDLYEVSSGKHKGQRHISKRGRTLIRKLLYFASLNTVRKGGIMHGKYQAYLKTGMKKSKALTAISRKLLGVMFALVRNHTCYNTQYPKLKEAA